MAQLLKWIEEEWTNTFEPHKISGGAGNKRKALVKKNGKEKRKKEETDGKENQGNQVVTEIDTDSSDHVPQGGKLVIVESD